MQETWYTVVSFGAVKALPEPAMPKGPWRTLEEADTAIKEWKALAGKRAKEHIEETSALLVGPYSSAHKARGADISRAKNRKDKIVRSL